MSTDKEKTSSKPPVKAQTYHGKTVSSVRDAVSGDPGFKGDGKNDQVVVTFADGEEQTVLRSDLVEA